MSDSVAKQLDFIHVGGSAGDSSVSLCLYAADIDIEHITTAAACAPTLARRRGEPTRGGTPAPIGLWSLDAPRDLAFDQKLRFLLDSTSREPDVWSSLAKGHEIQLRCVVYLRSWSEGIDVPVEILLELGSRCWPFKLCMYSADGDDMVGNFVQGRPLRGDSASS